MTTARKVRRGEGSLGDFDGLPSGYRRPGLARPYFYEGCWLAHHAQMENGDRKPRCEGRLVRVHLIPQHLLKRVGGEPGDPRSWVWSCGGVSGIGGHHGMLDSTRQLRVAFDELPAQTIEYAIQLGVLWWMERTYGGVR